MIHCFLKLEVYRYKKNQISIKDLLIQVDGLEDPAVDFT